MSYKRNKIIAVTITTSLLVSSCTTVNQYKGTITGCAVGVTAGYIANETKGAIIGGVLGCAAGYLWDRRQLQIQKVAEQNAAALATEYDKVVVETASGTKQEGFIMAASYVGKEVFAKGSSNLSEHGAKLYRDLANTYINDNNKILIIGHADSDGSASYNQRLSEQRAKTVANLFKANGISSDRLYYEGAGESRPVSDNNTQEGKLLNRRVEIVEFKISENATPLDQETIIAEYHQKILSDQRNIIQHQIEDSTNQQITQAVPKKQNSATIDFGGSVADEYVNYSQYLGAPKQPLQFSLFPTAHASENTSFVSCINDEPKQTSAVKRLTNNQPINYSTTDYLPGMNESVWLENVNGHLVSISPVSVLEGNLKISKKPTIKIYKSGYKELKQNKPNYTLKTEVDLYDGKDSFLMRIFSSDKTSAISCIDVILPKTGNTNAKAGSLYYKSSQGDFNANYLPHHLKNNIKL